MKELLRKMAAVADSLDREGLNAEANVVTEVMERVAQMSLPPGMQNIQSPMSPGVEQSPIMKKWEKTPGLRRYFELVKNYPTQLAEARRAILNDDEAKAKQLVDRYAGDPTAYQRRKETKQYSINPQIVNPLLAEAAQKGWNFGQLWSMAASRHNQNVANNIAVLIRSKYPNAPKGFVIPRGLKVDDKGNLVTFASEMYKNEPFDIMHQKPMASSRQGIFKKAQPRDMEEFYNEGWNNLPSVDDYYPMFPGDPNEYEEADSMERAGLTYQMVADMGYEEPSDMYGDMNLLGADDFEEMADKFGTDGMPDGWHDFKATVDHVKSIRDEAKHDYDTKSREYRDWKDRQQGN